METEKKEREKKKDSSVRFKLKTARTPLRCNCMAFVVSFSFVQRIKKPLTCLHLPCLMLVNFCSFSATVHRFFP